MTAGWTPIVHEIPPPEERAQLERRTRVRWVLELNEILAMAAGLTEAGYDVGDVIAKATAIAAAIDRRMGADPGRYLTDDLLDLDPDEVAERVRQAGVDLGVQEAIAQARRAFDLRLAQEAATSLRQTSDSVIVDMRGEFDKALAVVRAASELGLTPTTSGQQLLAGGTPEQIDAFRSLPDPVATLDKLARLRFMMADLAGIGPRDDLVIANIVADVSSTADLQSAQAIWRGEFDVVNYHDPQWHSSHPANVRRERVGGAWLALLCAGYKVRLNTGDEADQIVRQAARRPVQAED